MLYVTGEVFRICTLYHQVSNPVKWLQVIWAKLTWHMIAAVLPPWQSV